MSVTLVGTAMGSMDRSTDLEFLFEFSAACWLPHKIHYDAVYARHEGHEDVVVHGPLQGAYLGIFADEFARSVGGDVLKLSYRHIQPAYVGRGVRVTGEVVADEPGALPDDGRLGRVLTCSLVLTESATGRQTTTGTATVWVPQQANG